MTDVTQGQDALDDATLFSEAAESTTLDKFENPELQKPEPPLEPKKPEPAPPPTEPPKPDVPDAPVPSARLREEAEARRRAERERDDLLRQLAAARQPQPQQPPQKPPDLFENPSAYVQSEFRPYVDQIRQELQLQREANSQQWAISAYGSEKVAAAYRALAEGMQRGDPSVKAAYDQALGSVHPYDVITRWHITNENMREVGTDIAAYKKRILEEAQKDPDYQRQVIEASKSNATHVARPASSPVPKIPSLGNIGAGGDTELQEPSDEQLFRAATTAKRR